MGRICYFCRVKIHEKYLSRCLEIAKNALGTAAPNPMVGAIIVAGEHIIGEGYTSAFGGPHAEVNAIRSVKDPSLLKKATLYVSLEPCCHHGKTPPCADLILEMGIRRVVIGLRDPHDKVAGKGISRLREGGCEVIEGILESACREHHRRFLCYHEKERPYVILKWAQSLDGFIAPDPRERSGTPEPYWISSPRARQWVHKWRSEEQAILVGTRTALGDNPSLTTRSWSGRSPLRMVLDRQFQIPRTAHLMDGSAPTMLFHTPGAVPEPLPHINYQPLDFTLDIPAQILRKAWDSHLLSLIVEGGAKTLQSFIDTNLWDEARIFTGAGKLESGIPAPELSGRLVATESVGPDLLTIRRND